MRIASGAKQSPGIASSSRLGGTPRNEPLLKVSLSQDPALLKPILSVSAKQEAEQGSTRQNKIVFTIDCNYFLFIHKAQLTLYDQALTQLKTFSLPHPLPYRYTIDLKDLPYHTDTLHYQLSVFDQSGKEDRTGIGVILLTKNRD